MKDIIPQEVIENKIYLIRGHKVMLSVHLADLYGVKVKALVQAVKRNTERFPQDFMFQLTWQEVQSLRSQIVTLDKMATSIKGGHIKYEPYAFTEHGVSMLSSVLKSDRAVQINIFIMRTFVKLRQMISSNKDLASKFNSLELDQLKQGITLTKLYKYVKEFIDTPIPLEGKPGFNVEK